MTAALTTTFSPPSQCTTDIYFVPWYTSGYYYYVLGGQDYSSCLPASFTPTSEFFYTPGLHCPHGYSGAKTDSVSVGDELATIITCCPSGFSIQDGNSHSYPWIATLGCFSGISSSVDLSITAVSSSMGLARVTAGAVNAYSVQLRFRAVDLISTTTSSSTPSTTATTNTPSPTSMLSTTIPPSTAPTTTPGTTGTTNISLSAGAKAGIGVGSVFGVALVGALIYLAWTIRRSSRDRRSDPAQPHDAKMPDTGPGPGNTMPYTQSWPDAQRHELGDPGSYTQRPELG